MFRLGINTFYVALFCVLIYLGIEFLKHHTRLNGMNPLLNTNRGFSLEELPDLTGKIAVITGANSGLGFSTAKFLAAQNANTVLCCRNDYKCNIAVSQIRELHPLAQVSAIHVDLGNLSSIREFSKRIKKVFRHIDILILNAGIMGTPYTLSTDGLELQFAVNHVGHFYLTHQLLPLVRRGVKATGSATITVVSSEAHATPTFIPRRVYLTEEELNLERNYNPFKYYAQSKIANILFSNELAHRLGDGHQNIYVNSLHPGFVATELPRHFINRLPVFMRPLAGFFLKWLAWECDEASLTQLYTAVSPNISADNITGKFFHPVAYEFPAIAEAMDKDTQIKLWDFTERILSKRGFHEYEDI